MSKRKTRARANKPVVNCELCGRDTVNKCRLCTHCTGNTYGDGMFREDQHSRERRELWELMYAEGYTRDEDVDGDVSRAINDMMN
jgi:hypothetical protein